MPESNGDVYNSLIVIFLMMEEREKKIYVCVILRQHVSVVHSCVYGVLLLLL